MYKQFHNSIHQLLKKETQTAHALLDQSPLLVRLLSKKLELYDYQQTLACLSLWFFDAEDLLMRGLDVHHNLPYWKRKDELIRQDILLLQKLTLTHSGITRSKKCTRLSSFSDQYRLLGLLYVIEGSTLGGMAIAPKLKKTLGNTVPTQFYDCYEQNKVHFFNQTLEFIQKHIKSESQQIKVLEGANDAFASLQNFLSEYRFDGQTA